MPSSRNSPPPSHLLIQQHSVWLGRLSAKYSRPRAELARLLSAPGALEGEIAQLIADLAERKATELITTREWPPDGDDLLDRAIRGCWQRQRDAQYAAQAAEAQDLFAQLKKDSA